MKMHNFLQGSPEWEAHRAGCWNAGDAAAALGCSPYETRSELLARLHSGLAPEPTMFQQRLYDEGHEFEALARPLAEDILGEDLGPVVGSVEEQTLSRPLGASFDGLTFLGTTAWEHKRLNNALREVLLYASDAANAGRSKALPKNHRVQMEHQQIVAKNVERVLFTASEWEQVDGVWRCVDARHCWYESDPALRAEILAGWRQLEADLAVYVPPTAMVQVVAQPVQALPAVMVKLTGSITVIDNFKAFETAVRDFLEHRLIRSPKTDQDFADLGVQIKAMQGAEEALERAEAQMIAQIAAVDTAKKTMDLLHALVRENRLMAEKLLASEKERRRGEIVTGGAAALREHVAAANRRLGEPLIPMPAANFAAVIKGMRSLASMEDAVATELARAKSQVSEQAASVALNLAALAKCDMPSLFPDRAAIALKAVDDCAATIAARVAAEQRRQEQERERIRAEEAARLRREQEAQREAALQREREAEAAAERAAAERRAQQQQMTHGNGAPMFAAAVKENGDHVMLDADGKRSIFCDVDESDDPPTAPSPAAPSVVLPAPPAGPPTVKLGDICERLGISMKSDFVRSLGVYPAEHARSTFLYHETDFQRLCAALAVHIEAVARKHLTA